ncbi:hypothetical protein S100072_01311 [Bacillus velezensis]|nr:hypothetical protein S100072_01311 [Bacillus velezensis]
MFSMRKQNQSNLVISGVDVTSAIGNGEHKFIDALLAGRDAFKIMERAGR